MKPIIIRTMDTPYDESKDTIRDTVACLDHLLILSTTLMCDYDQCVNSIVQRHPTPRHVYVTEILHFTYLTQITLPFVHVPCTWNEL